MPSPKSGTAGTLVSPTDAGVAVDAIDAQPGSTETAPSQGTARDTETVSLTSTTSSDETTTDPNANDGETTT